MTDPIINAAPMTRFLGVKDNSTRAPVIEPEVLPTHIAKVYGYAQWGPTEAQLVVGDSRTNIYGDASFDMRKKWATHTTELSNTLNRKGNSQMFQRIVPADAGPKATLRLWADLLLTTIPLYERDDDGFYVLDEDGFRQEIEDESVSGYRVRFTVEEVSLTSGVSTFGAASSKAGTMADTDLNTTSMMYPLMDFEVAHYGSRGNDIGLRLWSTNARSSSPLDTRIVTEVGAYPINMAVIERPNDKTSPKIVETLSAEQSVLACLKPGALDLKVDQLLHVRDTFLKAHQEFTPGLPKRFGLFGRVHVYDNFIGTVLGLVYGKELTAAQTQSDFSSSVSAAEDKYRFNLFGGTTTGGVPYKAYDIEPASGGAVRLNDITNLWARGGGDGTMSNAALSVAVAAAVADYNNPNNPVQDTATNVESIMYDTGFSVPCKNAMANFIAYRHDTFVVLCTHVVGEAKLTASQESSLAQSLKTRLQMFPESDYFGTPCMRGMIVGRSGTRLNSQFDGELPLVLEIAEKAADYMGAGDGKWKPGFSFDGAPLHIVSGFRDINVEWTPATQRNKDWANGLVWAEKFSRSQCYFPALKTVYDNDTSVLNSFFTAMACVELQKVGDRCRRYHSGKSGLTNAQFIASVNKFIRDNTTGRFDDRFVIIPRAFFSEADEQRGFSWTLPIDLYAANMKTVMSLSIQAQRIEDLQA